MRHLKTTLSMVASLVLAVLLGLAGCGENHENYYRGDRDRYPERYERQDRDRYEGRQESERHEERGRESGHEQGEHGER